jgi:hypothetical protein
LCFLSEDLRRDSREVSSRRRDETTLT